MENCTSASWRGVVVGGAMLVFSLPGYAQTSDSGTQTSAFELNRSELRAGESMRRIVRLAHEAQANSLVDSIVITGSASPDGAWAYNRKLALKRAEAVKNYFCGHGTFPQSLFTLRTLGENEPMFRELVSGMAPGADRDRILRILDSNVRPDVKEARLKALDHGRVWRQLLDDIFPRLRMATTVVYLSDGKTYTDTISDSMPPAPGPEPVKEPEPEPAPVVEPEPEPVVVVEPEPVVAPEPEPEPVLPAEPEPVWRRYAYIKTNAPAWGLLWLNVAGEIDCAPHWSVELPVYYSGFNYFTGHLKARVLAIQPEARYWLHADNRGVFAGVHPGVMWYNFAFNGPTRYQDHNGNTPALGGGVSLGWRRSDYGHNKRWNFEFTVGFGIYRLDYDYFHNYCNGLKFDRRKRTFYGIDRVAFSFSYSFDITRKKKSADEPTR